MQKPSSTVQGKPHVLRPANVERNRLAADARGESAWKRWGPYLSERQWGTVREDYSAHGAAWDFFPHDHARSRAYRWGEDGLAGISDDQSRLCLALALWNGRDPILKERLFGLTNSEGNHGEDVKELYYYLDAVPTNSYLKMLYKYPHAAFPYAQLVEENARRDRTQPEFELLDTGVFDEDRYFDVFIEYAKRGPDEILMRVTVHNRGPEDAEIHVAPQLWFRNTWSWQSAAQRPQLSLDADGAIVARHDELGVFRFCADEGVEARAIFCENETNLRRLWNTDGGPAFPKDAFHDFIVHGRENAANPMRIGTKAAWYARRVVPAGGATEVRFELSTKEPGGAARARNQGARATISADFDAVFERRIAEANAFYADLQADVLDDDARRVQRQAFAGLIWNKQFFHLDAPRWLSGDPAGPPPADSRRFGRNHEWQHLNNADVLSVPDKWEYPWYAAWDLAFHCIPLALLDAEFSKQQLVLLTREWYMHPNGQLPAYEWAFGDVNPPVHAWATWRVFQIDRKERRRRDVRDPGDVAFLERVFHKLMLNFTWWVNRKDAEGRNVFQGGFLGMDNIGVFDRNAPLPTGGYINQADGTAWMGMYSLNLMRIALELARHNRTYEDIATKFFEHFLYIARAMTRIGATPGDGSGIGLWDEQDEFFYDVLSMPDGRKTPLKVRSMVGLAPLFAVEVLEPELLDELPEFAKRLEWFLDYRPDLASLVSRWQEPGRGERRLLSLLRGKRMKRLLRRMLDESEFLSDFGVRSVSKHHEREPYVFWCDGTPFVVRYQPGESDSGLFGGNSNWRGPIWPPVNYLLIESLQRFHHYYGDEFRVEYPTGSGRQATLLEVANELSRRFTAPFLRDADGRRPVFGANEKLQRDPHFRDHVLFYEYIDGDTGRGVGASHQCGWTALAAKLLMPRGPGVSTPRLSQTSAASGARGRGKRVASRA